MRRSNTLRAGGVRKKLSWNRMKETGGEPDFDALSF